MEGRSLGQMKSVNVETEDTAVNGVDSSVVLEDSDDGLRYLIVSGTSSCK